MAVRSHAPFIALVTALLALGCTTDPGETAEPGDSSAADAASNCIACHGSEEVLETEVEPDTGDSETEGSGEG